MLFRRATTVLALCVVATGPLSAQSATERVPVDALLRQIGAVVDVAHLPTTEPCTAGGKALASLCEGMIAVRRAELTGEKRDASHARDILETLVTEQPTWPMAWYVLAASRLAADEVGLSSRPGPLQQENAQNVAGAERALLHALTLDSTFLLAAQALVVAPIVLDSTSRLSARVAALRRLRRSLPPQYLFGEALVEREAGHLDSAVAIEIALLKNHAVPRGLVDITLAHDLFRTGNKDAATPVYFAGANDTAAVSRAAYRNELAWVASTAELVQWDSLPAAKRPEWLKRFWAIRDLRDGRPEGARLEEHYERVDTAFRLYRFRYPPKVGNDTLWLTGSIDYYTATIAGTAQPFHSLRSAFDVIDDRGLIYLRQGVPYLAMRMRDEGGLELWQYERPGEQLFVSFSAGLPPQRAVVLSAPHAQLLRTLSSRSGFVEPMMLVPTVAARLPAPYGGYMQGEFCALKASLCLASPDSSRFTLPRVNCTPAVEVPNISWQLGDPRFVSRSRFVDPRELIPILHSKILSPPNDAPYIHEREREEGWWSIDQATTTDAFPIPFHRQITASVEAHALRRADGTRRLVVAIGIPSKYLGPPDFDLKRDSVAYPVHMHIAALRESDGLRFDLDTVTNLYAPKTVTSADPLLTALDMPIPAGRFAASVWILQLGDSSGVQVHLDSVSVPGPSQVLRVSDLILGPATSPVRWNSGEGMVPLNPFGTFAKGGDAEIYFQVSGAVQGVAYQTRYEFFRDGDELAVAPQLTITSAAELHADLAAVQRTLGLTTLVPGRYRVRLTVSGGGQSAVSTGCLVINR